MSLFSRFITFIIYIATILGLSLYGYNSFFAPADIIGAWYYSAIAYLLLSLFTAPFFLKPTDTIATAFTAITIILTANIPSNFPAFEVIKIGKRFIVSYCAFSIIISIIAIVFRNREIKLETSSISRSAFWFSDKLGRGEVVFSFVFIFSILCNIILKKYLSLYFLLFWLLIILIQPHEIIAKVYQSLKKSTEISKDSYIGSIRAFENPGFALIALASGKEVKVGTKLFVLDRDANFYSGLAVGDYKLQNEKWLRVLLGSLITFELNSSKKKFYPNSAYIFNPNISNSININVNEFPDLKSDDGPLIGFVAEGSSTYKIQIELLNPNADIYEGRLVSTNIRNKKVLYQIVDALTQSENLENKSSLGFLRIQARKVGTWNQDRKSFKSTRWLPDIHTPVYLWEEKATGFQYSSIGFIPGSKFSIELDPILATTHNTAILGVLGSGKTCLTLELIVRLITKSIKVFCIDITGQYSNELSDLYNHAKDKEKDEYIRNQIASSAGNVSLNVEEGGNWQLFKDKVKEDIIQFLNDTNRYIRIYNPESYVVRRQDSKPFNDRASMTTLTPVEITRIICENLLNVMSDRLTNEARVCVVFEEAHSLIPEWNSISFEGDRKAAMGTTKAILQGRKYGLGCIIVTQRTANVTKSVLNQCNTVFALRTFDATGMDFLSNYIGEEYTNILSSLEERHAVIYGRAISSDSPLIIQLNDREEFLRHFRSIQNKESSA